MAAVGDTGTRRKLDSRETIGGLSCIRYAWTDADARLQSCFLDEAAEVAGHLLPGGTRIHFDDGGKINYCFLGRDTKVEGHMCRGKGHGYMTSFHPNGRLRLCWLAASAEIQGVPCRRATFLADLIGESVGVYFHPDGSLTGCELYRKLTVEGRTFRKGYRIELNPGGNPVAKQR